MEKFYCVGCKKHHDLEVLEATEQNGKGGSIRYSLRSVCPSGHKTNKLCKREIYEAYGAEVSEPMAAEGMTVGVNLEALAPTADEPESGVALVPEDSLMPEGSGRTIGSQSVSHNYTPFHSEDDEVFKVHTSGKCPVCKSGNIAFFTDDVGTLRQCWDCGSEWNDEMEITIDARPEEYGAEGLFCPSCKMDTRQDEDQEWCYSCEKQMAAETFIAYPELKDHLVAVMPDKIYGVKVMDDGDFEMKVANRYMDEVISVVSDYQMNEEPESSGFLGSGFSKTTVAVATATLAVGLAYYFNRK